MKVSLTEEEWNALRDHVSLYTDLVPSMGEKKDKGIEFEMSAKDWDELNGYIAAEANHVESRKLEKLLDRVYFRIGGELRKRRT